MTNKNAFPYFSLFTGTINGLYTIFVGILFLILRREQVYVLTSVFILVFFQMFFLLLSLVFYIFIIFTPDIRCKYSYIGECRDHTNLIITNFGLIVLLITLCMAIYNLVIIRNGRQLPKVPLTAVQYSQPIDTTEYV